MASEHEVRLGTKAHNKRVTVTTDDADLRPWDLDTKLVHVGTDLDRIDGIAKATGRAKFTFDVKLPGMLYGVIYRSPHARARLVSLDLSGVKDLPGVVAVVALKKPGDRLRFLGDEVAAIAATSLDLAVDALEKIGAEFQEQQHNVELLKADDAPALDGNGQVVDPWPEERGEEVEEQLKQAAVTHTATFRTEVQTHSSLETHGVVAQWTGKDLEIWASTQGTFGMRAGVSRALQSLGIDVGSVVVNSEFIGGGFGSKLSPGRESVAAALLANEASAPVKLMLDRYEEHTCTGNRPSALMQIRAGAAKDGTLTAWDYRSWGGPGYPGRGGRTTFPAHYLEAAKKRAGHRDLPTDTDAGRPMRAPGWPQGYFGSELFLDEMAVKLGMDPLELRQKNDPQVIRKEQWELGAARFGWPERRNPTPGKPRGNDSRYLQGAGLASARWGGMGGPGRPPHGITCRIHADGTVEARSGAQDIGGGMKTVMALLTAEELGIEPERVKVTMGRTDDPSGPMSGGSQTTPSLAPAVRHAAALANEQLVAAVAEHLGVKVDEIDYGKGTFKTAGKPPLKFREACKLIGPNPIETQGRRFGNYEAYNSGVCGCQFAEVVVDTWTGQVRVTRMLAVQDCGLVIAKKLAESQVLGAMIQGLSYALHEQRIMDPTSGRMLNGDFQYYKIAGPADMPNLEAIMFSVANGGNNVGAVGLGEPPAVAAPAAIANAVFNATGVPLRHLPITPDKVLAALGQRKGG